MQLIKTGSVSHAANTSSSYTAQDHNFLVCRKTAAAMLGLSTQTLAHWASTKRHNLPFVKLGARCMYLVSDIHDFIKQNRVIPGNLASVKGVLHERS